MVDGFDLAFGDSFDKELPEVTNFIDGDEITLAGIKFLIAETEDAFDIEIPQIDSVYIHMLGHDVHSIINSRKQAMNMIDQLRSFIDKDYDLVLSAHYAPETVKDVAMKIDYLKQLIKIADRSRSANEFNSRMKAAFPSYGGENYLNMTTGLLFEQ